MTKLKKLPIGVEDFAKLRTEDYYFVDKTDFISDFLENHADVTLFTRPRRFGKSLMLNTLKAFLDISGDPSIFEGLKVTQNKEICEKYRNQYPVLLLSLKDVEDLTYQAAMDSMKSIIGRLAMEFQYLNDSPQLTKSEKKIYRKLISFTKGTHGTFAMSDKTTQMSLWTLTNLLYKHHQKRVILLIDEYDVPLNKASENGYYEEMLSFFRSFFNTSLKSNPYLDFAVLTGCLRLSKASIFTGMNNIRVNTLTNHDFTSFTGFTTTEISELLEYYNLQDAYPAIKDWYDGYRFGGLDIYCPWDVLNYCYDLLHLHNPATEFEEWFRKPKNYWINTSGNYIIRSLLTKAQTQNLPEIEHLIQGGTISKKIDENITYPELEKTIDHIWSVLLSTGYLTCTGIDADGYYQLKIPNMEVRSIFVEYILAWTKETLQQPSSNLPALCEAVKQNDTQQIQNILNEYLARTISIRDTFVPQAKKENFYHGIMLGLLEYGQDWSISSNADAGDGYSDIQIRTHNGLLGIIIEIKYADNGAFDLNCKKALEQIQKEKYEQEMQNENIPIILKYGIAFYKKRCMVISGS